jgi:hypothetical protein
MGQTENSVRDDLLGHLAALLEGAEPLHVVIERGGRKLELTFAPPAAQLEEVKEERRAKKQPRGAAKRPARPGGRLGPHDLLGARLRPELHGLRFRGPDH